SSPHGPCGSGSIGNVEYDHAHCFVSDFWPPSASSWIDRCHSWPPPHFVNDIIRNGCHFVAIGHKLGNHTDNEWRISFSQAEYKLVCSMNHTQFLTYGLLKLFLKEIINEGLRDEDKLLCSYHMKTAIFWAIQQNALPRWCPQNLLVGFWVCFKLLLKWVYEGVCPNFFIPENNMFLCNIYGEAQKTLFTRLYRLYENGIPLLLHMSLSIRSDIINVLCNPRLTICADEHTLISEVEFDEDIFGEIEVKDSITTLDLHTCEKHLHMVEQLSGLPLTQYHIVMLQKLTATILQHTAFILHSMYTYTCSNKQLYIVNKVACRLMKLSAKFGFVSDMLYIAMYYYKTFRYRDALSVIDLTKVKLAQPYLMYRSHVDRESYTEAVGGQSLSTKMRQAVARNIIFENTIFYINELMPEQQSSNQNNQPILIIPPLVLLYMLEFLCSRHVDTMRAQKALDDLLALVHHDQGQLVPVELRDISWEILGICQQITEDLQGALFSYQQSLRQDPENEIQTATRQRIRDLHL
uniref:Mab-21-like HhH/H2TH-like domain-containing protein n=1 Tax=Magallana gigas TaxID=29159 RepID=A0A8W8JG74_MAGGI